MLPLGTEPLPTAPESPIEASPARFAADSRLERLGAFELEVIDQPARTLGAGASVVLSALMRLSRENLASDPSSYLEQHFRDATALVVVRLGAEIVGLSLASLHAIEGRHHVWIRLTVLAPEARGSLLMLRVTALHVWRAMRAAFPRSFFVLTRTANPRVVGSLVASPRFFPRPDRPTPTAVREGARAFCRAEGCEVHFDADAMVLRGAVLQAAGQEEAPTHHREAINAMCRERLAAPGDRLLMVARLSVLDVLGWSLLVWIKSLTLPRR